jgi:hypothetical protein
MGDRRCAVCARVGDLDDHHVAGRAHLPDVIVPVCRTRHLAWHRLIRAAGSNLSGLGIAAQLTAIAVGFRVVLEDGAALGEDPVGERARVRACTECALSLIDAVFGEPLTSKGVAMPPRAARPLAANGSRVCLPRQPRTERERRERSISFSAGMLPALAALLEAILPVGVKPEPRYLVERLGGIDPERLADGACAAEASKPTPELPRRLAELFDGDTPTLAELGQALLTGVQDLERIANVRAADV